MARSTLELLLDSIKERDEEAPHHLPALPQRPTSRARLPSRKKTSVLCFDQSSDQYMRHRFSHTTDAASHCSNGNRHQEHEHHRHDEGSPAFENGSRKEMEMQDKFVPATAMKIAMEFCSHENSSAGNGGLSKLESFPEKQAPAPSFIRLKRRRGDRGLHGLQKDSKVWFMNDDNIWVLGNVRSVQDLESSSLLCVANDKCMEIPIKKLLPVNPEFINGVDDLVHLIYIHEPALFHVLQQRYELGMFCTRAGSSCIVLTPSKEYLQSCSRFHQSLKEEASSIGLGSEWSPLHSLCNKAHDSLLKDWKNQSIIVGGESCGGKTESAEAVLRHLISLGNNEELGNALLNCNVVLEAFGNTFIDHGVRISRNGKLIEFSVDRKGNICSAHIQIVFLEKSRVVCQAEKELSFNIFYQLCELADTSRREKLNLMNATRFYHLNNFSSIKGAHPFPDFQLLLNAFDGLGFTKENQEDIFSLLGSILWLGNMSAAINDDEAIDNAANLLHCSKNDLLDTICAGGLDSADVLGVRDAVACALYEMLCNWLVSQMNQALTSNTVSESKKITIVDMPGFGFSKSDGLEGLLVNYVQDHLHQFTRRHLLQQWEEVATCGEPGSYSIDSSGDDERINFLEYDIFPLLAKLEEDVSDQSSESVLSRSIESLSAESPCCKEWYKGKFKLIHTAGEMTYSVGSLLRDMKAISCTRNSQLLQAWMDRTLKNTSGKENFLKSFSEELSLKQSCISNSQKQVLHMMHQLEDTEPHFIFCVAPCKSNLAQRLDQSHVIQQLRIHNVIESLRISRSGQVVSIPLELFASRFKPLLGTNMKNLHCPLGISAAVLQCLQVPSCTYQIGWTRIFFCSEQVERLEHARHKLLNGIVSIQKSFRGFRERKKLESQQGAVTLLQASVRGWLVRKGFSHQRDEVESKKKFAQNGRKDLIPEHSMQVLGHSQDSIEDGNPSEKEGTVTKLSSNIFSLSGRSSELELELAKQREFSVQENSSTWDQSHVTHETDVELALKKKDEEISVLMENLKEYERRRIAYESQMKSMEEMWQKQVSHLEQRLSVATKGSNTEESAHKAGDSDKALVFSTPLQCDSTRDTPETPSCEPDSAVFKDGLDPNRSILDNLHKELEHRTQVFNDDAKFLVEVKSGQITADFKPDEELRRLEQRFEVWKKVYKGRLKETKGLLKKLGKSKIDEKNRKRWWSRK